MYLDETTTKLLVFLAAALIAMIFIELSFVFETNKECKQLRRQNGKLRRAIAESAVTEEDRHEAYRAEFERNMKRNTADPARHEMEEPYV